MLHTNTRHSIISYFGDNHDFYTTIMKMEWNGRQAHETSISTLKIYILIMKLSIPEYRDKRDFAKTPEPTGNAEQQENKGEQKTKTSSLRL